MSNTDKEHWRVGRSVKRTIYVARGPEKSKADLCIGMLDTPYISELVVDAVNEFLIHHPERGILGGN